jgi:hypothetical protein
MGSEHRDVDICRFGDALEPRQQLGSFCQQTGAIGGAGCGN